MAKKDLTITSDNNSVGSRSAKIKEHEKALEVLAKAKQIPRKVVFLKKGEGEFTRNKKSKNQVEKEEMLNSNQAAAYLGVSYHTFAVRQTKKHLPYEKRFGNRKFFRIPDLNRFQSHFNK